MPLNKAASDRYHLIDSCLRNKLRPFPSKEYIVDQIREKLNEVSTATFDKDIAAMKKTYGAPIAYHKERKGYYYTDDIFTLNKFPLNAEEVTALDLSTSILRRLKFSPILNLFEAAINKVISTHRIGKITGKSDEEYIQVEQPLADNGSSNIEPLYKAITEKQALNIVYQAFERESKEHVISPYLLKEYRNRWYVVGYSNRSKNSIVLALDRIQSLKPSKEKFFTDKSFVPLDYFKYSFGVTQFHEAKPEKVVLSFTNNQANYILSQPMHHSQEIISRNETETVIALHVYITQELLMTILGYGDVVKVLEPESLVGTIKDTIANMNKIYSQSK